MADMLPTDKTAVLMQLNIKQRTSAPRYLNFLHHDRHDVLKCSPRIAWDIGQL
jgi:hypothetical protein